MEALGDPQASFHWEPISFPPIPVSTHPPIPTDMHSKSKKVGGFCFSVQIMADKIPLTNLRKHNVKVFVFKINTMTGYL